MESDGIPGFEFWLGMASIFLAVYYTYRNKIINYQN